MWGAEQGDAVRLHGAITAALNLNPKARAYAHVLAPALDRLQGRARQAAYAAMAAHLLQHDDPAGWRQPMIAARSAAVY